MGLRVIISIMMMVLLGSCATKLQQLKDAAPSGNTFQLALAREYLAFAESEADGYDWSDSNYFAKKGLKAVHGEDVPPERVEDRDVSEDAAIVLAQAREGLLDLLSNPKAMAEHFEDLAKAQFYYDCWIEQQEEGWQADEIAACRDQFYTLVDRLYAATTPPPHVVDVAKPVEAPEVYFSSGSSKLDKKSKESLKEMAKELKGVEAYDITLNAFADRVGNEEVNLKLSKKRAQAVKKVLVAAGLRESAITIFAFGESDAKVTTKDNIAEKGNRVVEIVVDKK